MKNRICKMGKIGVLPMWKSNTLAYFKGKKY